MTLSIQDREILANRIVPLVTAELMARLRADTAPPYEADIVEVLDFVRRNPDPDLPRYAIVRIEDGFEVVVRARTPGRPPEFVDGVRYPDRGAAEFAVLARRLKDYGVTW
ncbi:hypothetical protein ACEYYH_02335 [Microbacterium trichothecenolyticum]|uniref:hypothetical protein n=1 Tax=Microbacterium trichothecenolyticum TaxID=69370 RepID=UPI0035BE8BC4